MLKIQISIFDKDKKEWITSEGKAIEEGEVLEFIQQYDWKEQIKEITEKLEKQEGSYGSPNGIGIENAQGLMLWVCSWEEGIYTVSAKNDNLPDKHPDAFIGANEIASIEVLEKIIEAFIHHDLENLRLLFGQENNLELLIRKPYVAVAKSKLITIKATIGFWLFLIATYLFYHVYIFHYEFTLMSLGQAVLAATLFIGFIYGMGYYIIKKHP